MVSSLQVFRRCALVITCSQSRVISRERDMCQHGSPVSNMLIFDSVFYHLPLSLSPQRRTELSSVLDANGAQQVQLNRSKLTHVITNTNRFEGWESVKDREGVKVVTVRRCVFCSLFMLDIHLGLLVAC
jgi:hypothetical protein